jgi:uncharacterized membrane protein
MDSGNLLICKACGYKISSSRLKKACPACEVSSKYFKPYEDNISIKRNKLLGFHIHPIIVHFSVATSILLFLTIATGSFLSSETGYIFFNTASVLSVLLPLFAIAGAVSGIIDGVLRFKKAKRPILIKKISLSVGFFISSLVLIIFLFIFRFDHIWINLILIILSLTTASFSLFLGKLGGGLSEAILPGK